MKRSFTNALCSVTLVCMANPASSALLSRIGGQAYYDDVLDITWLRDANLAASNTFGLPYNTDLGNHPSSGYSGTLYTEEILPDGRMNWGAAMHWIDAMNNDGGTGYLGYDDWRLPMMHPDPDNKLWDTCSNTNYLDPDWHGTNCGYNVMTGSADTVIYSEMASLWYDSLGNLAPYDTSGSAPQPGWGLSNVGPFQNLTGGTYFYGTTHADPINADDVWSLATDDGLQFPIPEASMAYGWAVRTGDVREAPVPGAVWLFGSGLVALIGFSRRNKA